MRFRLKEVTSNGIIIGTGPSLSEEQLAWALRKKRDFGWALFGVNNTYKVMPWIDVLMSCNIEWWDHYWKLDPLLRYAPFAKWTWDAATAERYGINHIPGIWAPSLSKDNSHIHYGHASGYQILGLAYHYGIRSMYLLGFDMAYPPGKPRHFFGEYPEPLVHRPRVGPKGEFTGLLEQFKTIDEKELGITITNLSPNSALDHFKKGTIDGL